MLHSVCCPRRRGFTLIELLVVIAIIAILAAILFPVFISARNASKAGACTQNLRQLSMAFGRYMDDYQLRVPPTADGYVIFHTPGGPGGYVAGAIGWTERLYIYHKKIDLYKCPARKVNFGYTYNGNLGNSINGLTPSRPSKLIIIFDVPGSGAGPISNGGGDPSKEETFATGNADQTNEGQTTPRKIERGKTWETYSWPYPRVRELNAGLDSGLHSQLFLPGPHNGKVNMLYFDGHVKSVERWDPSAMTLTP